MNKSFYKLNLILLSPLSIGSGAGMLTDSDVYKNSLGEPAIPASAIAGILRSKVNNPDSIFGNINDSISKESKILTFDAEIEGEYHITVRDCVKLTNEKISEKGSKFDFEVVESGAKFVTYIETSGLSSDEKLSFESELLSSNTFTMGKKGTRGYGVILIDKIIKKSFCLDNIDDYNSYLNFRMFSDKFENATSLSFAKKNYCDTVIELHLLINGSPMIRKYSTEPNESKEKPAPDFSQLTTEENGKTIPVIPGTSWSGAFRSHMLKLGLEMGHDENNLNNLFKDSFGFVSGNSSQKSKVVFSESQIVPIDEKSPLCNKVITRTSIDRLLGGSSDRSLFTQRTFFGGKTILKITIDSTVDDLFFSLLAAAIKDLDLGIMSIGGQTSVGHGLFNVAKILVNENDVEIFDDNFKIDDAATLLRKGGTSK